MNGSPFAPKYFSEFSCLASRCEDSCCRAGWLIPVDSESVEFYRKNGIDIDSGTVFEDGDRCFRLTDGKKCVYLSEDGLCELYTATGRQCEICAKYPRFFEEYDGFTESGLAPSCPAAAKLILEYPENPYTDLKRYPSDRLLEFLCSARELAIGMIYSEPDPDTAAKKLLGFGYDLQELIDFDCLDRLGEVEFLPYEWGLDTKSLRKTILEKTEILSDRWRRLLSTEPTPARTDVGQKRNYLGYLTYRYFLKAINSEDIFSECGMIYSLFRLSGELCADYGEAVKLICRELEHDAENMEMMREWVQ